MDETKEYVVDGEFLKIWFDHGILCTSYQTEFVDLHIAKTMVSQRLSACNSQSYPLFADFRKVKTLQKDARHYLAKEGGAELVTACALLIESPLSKLIGNFFLNINKPIRPFKIFTNEKEAMKWLQKFVL